MGAITHADDPAWTTDSGITLNNTVTDGTLALSTTAIDNNTPLRLKLEVELELNTINPTGAPYIELHIRPRLSDNTNYADAFIGGPTLAFPYRISTGSGVKKLLWCEPRYPLFVRPGRFTLGIGNRTGQTLNNTGNVLKYRLITPSVS